jgi:hypothetical protein
MVADRSTRWICAWVNKIMKIQELPQRSQEFKTDQLLDRFREQAAQEAERMMAEYLARVAEDPSTPHPSQILDQQIAELLCAIK